jgi:hypothetical protein
VVQRSLTVLPLRLNRAAVQDAEDSSEWRLQMWRALLPEIPKYFWLGKGFAIDPTDLYLAEIGAKMGTSASYESSLIAGDYHSGPLTLIIPFGIFGVLTFIWFLIAGGRVLWRNYRYGDPAVQNINTFLWGFFLARVVFYITIFGAFYIDLATFIGTVGISIAINHGMCEAPSRAPAAAGASWRNRPRALVGGLQPA